MNIPGLRIEKGAEHLFDASVAIVKLGNVDALFAAIEDIQREGMVSGFHAVKLVSPSGGGKILIRLTADHSVSRPGAAKFLQEAGLAVEA